MHPAGSPGQSGFRQNHLLASLPETDLLRLGPHLDLRSLRLGEKLCESGESLAYAYFPTTAVISLLYVVEGGTSADLMGNEGVLGIALVLGGNTMPLRAEVRSAGCAFRIKGEVLLHEFSRAEALQGVLLRYTLARLVQMMQTAACNRHHSTEQQLCRWLLLAIDRLAPVEPWITRELIATLLEKRPQAVEEAAGNLERERLVQLHQGRIIVTDRPGLEKRACECYRVVRREYRRLFPDVSAVRSEGTSS